MNPSFFIPLGRILLEMRRRKAYKDFKNDNLVNNKDKKPFSTKASKKPSTTMASLHFFDDSVLAAPSSSPTATTAPDMSMSMSMSKLLVSATSIFDGVDTSSLNSSNNNNNKPGQSKPKTPKRPSTTTVAITNTATNAKKTIQNQISKTSEASLNISRKLKDICTKQGAKLTSWVKIDNVIPNKATNKKPGLSFEI